MYIYISTNKSPSVVLYTLAASNISKKSKCFLSSIVRAFSFKRSNTNVIHRYKWFLILFVGVQACSSNLHI